MTLNRLNCDTVICWKMLKTKVRCTYWALHDVNSNPGLWCVSGTLMCFWVDRNRWFFKCTACLDRGWNIIDTSPQLIEKTGLVLWNDTKSTFLAKSKARIKCNFSVVNWPGYSLMLPATLICELMAPVRAEYASSLYVLSCFPILSVITHIYPMLFLYMLS